MNLKPMSAGSAVLSYAERFLGTFNDYFYSYILLIILLAAGLYFTVKTRFVQVRFFGEQIRCVTERPDDKKSISSFQALMVSTASRVGTGNIIGVSTALCLGGFGSIFWMWAVAVVGSAIAFVESTLAQIFKKRGQEGCYGGPAYYIEALFGKRAPGIAFSILLILTYGVGFNMLTSYNLQSTFSQYSFYDERISPYVIGIATALLVALCYFGGGRAIIKVTSFLVPIMGVAYILVALFVVAINMKKLPSVFYMVFSQAFDFKAIFGGLSSSCLMYGIKRGLLSNEAGVGSAPNASAAAEVSHPVKQGLVQLLSVTIDTVLICSATAFMCMCSDVEPSAEISGAKYVQLSVADTLGSFGPVFITFAMVLFGFTTLVGNMFYIEGCAVYIMKKQPGKKLLAAFKTGEALLVFVGCILSAELLWNIADVTMGLMISLNVPVTLLLGRYALRALKDYEKQKKAGKNPVFNVKNINLPYRVDYWNK